jgi:uncharacterized membrane protein YkvI
MMAMALTPYQQLVVTLFLELVFLAMAMALQKVDHQKPKWLLTTTRYAGHQFMVSNAMMQTSKPPLMLQ